MVHCADQSARSGRLRDGGAPTPDRGQGFGAELDPVTPAQLTDAARELRATKSREEVRANVADDLRIIQTTSRLGDMIKLNEHVCIKKCK